MAGAPLTKKPQLPEDPYQKVRELMVRDQIQKRGVRDPRILSIFRVVPRHRFLPESGWDRAYLDKPVEIGHDATISQPYIVAAMTEMLGLKGVEKVLEIGSGSGYQAAILAELAGEVFSIEIVPELAERARTNLEALGYRNVQIREGDGSKGWPEEAPFEAILVTAAPSALPTALLNQLSEGGKLVIPIGQTEKQNLYVFTKTGGTVKEEKKFEVRFVPLLGRSEGHA